MACSDYIEPLDLKCILVNSLSGNFEIFSLLMVALLSGASAYFKMPNGIFMTMIGLFIVIMSKEAGMFSLYTLTIFITAVGTFWGISRFSK